MSVPLNPLEATWTRRVPRTVRHGAAPILASLLLATLGLTARGLDRRVPATTQSGSFESWIADRANESGLKVIGMWSVHLDEMPGSTEKVALLCPRNFKEGDTAITVVEKDPAHRWVGGEPLSCVGSNVMLSSKSDPLPLFEHRDHGYQWDSTTVWRIRRDRWAIVKEENGDSSSPEGVESTEWNYDDLLATTTIAHDVPVRSSSALIPVVDPDLKDELRQLASTPPHEYTIRGHDGSFFSIVATATSGAACTVHLRPEQPLAPFKAPVSADTLTHADHFELWFYDVAPGHSPQHQVCSFAVGVTAAGNPEVRWMPGSRCQASLPIVARSEAAGGIDVSLPSRSLGSVPEPDGSKHIPFTVALFRLGTGKHREETVVATSPIQLDAAVPRPTSALVVNTGYQRYQFDTGEAVWRRLQADEPLLPEAEPRHH